MIEATPAERATPGQRLRETAEALLARYPAAPAAETESALAVLALWAIDAVEDGRLPAADADSVFTLLDVEIDESASGPDLSERATQLLLEGMTLHDQGTEFSADLSRMRSLAFGILRPTP